MLNPAHTPVCDCREGETRQHEPIFGGGHMDKAPIRSAGDDLLLDASNGHAADAWWPADSIRCDAASNITFGCERD